MEPGYQERYVACIDILGFRELTERVRLDVKLFQTVVRLFDEVRTFRQRGYLERHCPDTRIDTFSDTILISCPVKAEGLATIFWAILIFFDGILTSSGLLLRGAIAKGEFFHSEHTYFGPALNQAFDMEKTVAVNPRIVLSKAVFADVQNFRVNPDLTRWFDKMVRRDPLDGVPFLHLLLNVDPTCAEIGARLGQPSPEAVKILIDRELGDLVSDPNAYRKWKWFAQYFEQTMSTSR